MEQDILISPLFDLNHENREFRCDNCEMYLSIAPILYNETVGKICGRCFDETEQKKFVGLSFVRQKVYEGIASKIVFPCSFQLRGCQEKLKWSSVNEHESLCPYKREECPFGKNVFTLAQNKCDWKGSNTEIITHLKQKHMDNFQEFTKMTISSTLPPKNCAVWSEFLDTIFIAVLFVPTDLQAIFLQVLMNASSFRCEDFTYNLVLSNSKRTKTICFPGNEVASLCNKALKVKWLKTGFNINMEALNILLNESCFNLDFKIKSKKSVSSNAYLEGLLHENLIFNYKCVACGCNLTPPIHICDGCYQSACNICYDNSEACQSCRGSIIKYRNNVLENMSRIALYECENKNHGCTELLNFEQLQFHEENCFLTIKPCVLGCCWTGNNVEMLKHVGETHYSTNLRKFNLYTPDSNEKFYHVVVDGCIFILQISYKLEDNLSFIVQHLGVNKKNYKFAFKISSGPLKLGCCNFCYPKLYGQKIEKPKSFVFPYEFLKQFLINEKEFLFELDIFEVKTDIQNSATRL